MTRIIDYRRDPITPLLADPHYNQDAKPYVWSATTKAIIAKVQM